MRQQLIQLSADKIPNIIQELSRENSNALIQGSLTHAVGPINYITAVSGNNNALFHICLLFILVIVFPLLIVLIFKSERK